MKNIPILKFLLVIILSSILLYFDFTSAIVYLPFALIFTFFLSLFNVHIFKLGIDRFSFMGIICLIGLLIGILVPSSFNQAIPYYSLKKLGFSELAMALDANFNIFINNIRFQNWYFGIALAPIFWILNYEIFLTKEKKIVFLEGIRIDMNNLIDTKKGLYYSFYVFILLTSLFTNSVIFYTTIACITILFLIKISRQYKYMYVANLILMIDFCLLFIISIKHSYTSNIGDSIRLLGYAFHKQNYIDYFFHFRGKIEVLNGTIFVYLLVISISLIIEAMRSRFHSEIESGLKKQELDNVLVNKGFYIGNFVNGNKKLVLPIEELNQHLYVNATTGGGKTTLFLRMINESKKFNMPIIFIDGKGSVELIDKFSEIAKNSGRKFKFFTFGNYHTASQPSKYDFLGVGNRDEIRNKLMNLLDSKENQFYYERLTAFVTRILIIIEKAIDQGVLKKRLDLMIVFKLISQIDKLTELVNKVGDESDKKYFAEVMEMKEKPQERMVNTLTPFIYSNYSQLLDLQDSDNIINLVEAIKNNEIILFLLNSSSYVQDTEKFGKIIIDDINASFSALANQSIKKQSLVIFDEFASYASKSIATSISIHRSNGLHAMIGSQSLETIKNNTDGELIVSTIVANCNTKILLKTNNQYDMELFANAAGTEKDYAMTHQMDTTTGGNVTGMGSMRTGNKYRVDIQDLRGLPSGMGYIYRTSNNKVLKVKFAQ
ncbi:MAG: type IV secretory system conjugative DNA transfer family protein [Neisseriaceae bacterium]